VSITDADDPSTYAEFRGVVERIEEDPGGACYETLAQRYGAPWGHPGDPRVIFFLTFTRPGGRDRQGQWYNSRGKETFV